MRSAYTLLYDENKKSAVWAAYDDVRVNWHCFQFIARSDQDDWVSEALTAGDLAGLAEQDMYVHNMPLVSFAGTLERSQFPSNATVRSRSLSQEPGTGLTGRFEIW